MTNEKAYSGKSMGDASSMYLGKVMFSGPRVSYFDGELDDVRIYNRALTSDEVVVLYEQDATSLAPLLSPLENQTCLVGGTATFNVKASGTPPLNYQWYFDNTPLTNGGHYSGATSSSLVIANVQAANTGDYAVVVQNSTATVTSSVVTLSSIELQMLPGLIINGLVGYPYRVDYRDSVGDTTTWKTLTNFNLPTNPFIYIDASALGLPKRFYRAVQTP